MIELDLSDQIASLRRTFDDIKAVIGVEKLEADIADLSEKAGAPDLWDDPDAAQKITSALSHRQSELARVTGFERRLDDLEVLVQLATEGEGDAESAAEAQTELTALQQAIGGVDDGRRARRDQEVEAVFREDFGELEADAGRRPGDHREGFRRVRREVIHGDPPSVERRLILARACTGRFTS